MYFFFFTLFVESPAQAPKDISRSGSWLFCFLSVLFVGGAQPVLIRRSPPREPPPSFVLQACSLTELDEKISAVKAALLKRVNEFGSGYGAECAM